MRQLTREADVKAEIKKLFKKYDWFYWMPGASGYGVTGVADFLALKNGRPLAVEAKFGNNKPTAMQRKFLESFALYGGVTLVIDETNLGILEEVLRVGS